MPIKPPNIPVNAPRIWSDSDWLYASCPSPDGAMAHLLRFHNDPEGWSQLKRMISTRRPSAKLGEPGDPIQYVVDMEYAEDKVTRIHRGKPVPPRNQHSDAVAEVLKRMGLI